VGFSNFKFKSTRSARAQVQSQKGKQLDGMMKMTVSQQLSNNADEEIASD
jgi:hypothetical protein